MKFGLYGLHRGSSVDRDVLSRRAITAEDAGFESIWVGDHLVGDDARFEALVALTYIAAVTQRIQLAVGVLVLPQRHPVLLAKQLTSIEVLSRGRLTVGIGVGYVESELNAFGVSLAERASRTDANLDAMRAIWSESAQPHRPPPIVVGGHSDAALDRATRVADGWFGWDLDVDDAAGLIARLRSRRPDGFEITVKPKAPVDLDLARRYAQIGVDRLILHPADVNDDSIDGLISNAAENLIGNL
jgi:alkanesulfonate monooxygenase SsuD/methylene tetrahydromethanopterin reductase-like flavin-dependent oxidoreductase (luciferase family)